MIYQILRKYIDIFSNIVSQKAFCAIILAILMTNSPLTDAQERLSAKYLNYIDEYKDIAIEQQRLHGIPASITLAQGLLESQAGFSRLATAGNNHFGIKCTDWNGDTIRHDDDARQECFRSYASAAESYNDHSLFLKRKRYQPLYDLAITDYKGWAKTLKKCGYATDPKYPDKLIGIIETYELFQYDDAKYQSSKMMADATPKPEKKPKQQPQKVEEEDKKALESDVEIMLAAEIGQQHVVRRRWGLYYVTAREGDTFTSLGKELDVKPDKLAKFNDMRKKDAIAPGDVIWLETKAKKATDEHSEHLVAEGETLHSVAQYYGIQLKSLAKLNKIKPDAAIAPGSVLMLR